MIILKNKTNQLKTYNLDRHHGTVRKFPQIRALANGSSIGEIVNRKLPDSITFLAKETKGKWKENVPLPASLLTCPDIDSAIQRGELVQVKGASRVAPPTSGESALSGVASSSSVGDDSDSGEISQEAEPNF